MFCTQCGKQVPEGAVACASCGAPSRAAVGGAPVGMAPAAAGPAGTVMAPAPVPGAQVGQQVRDQVVTSSRDAARALRALAIDPVSGLPAAYSELGERAVGAGVALCLFFAVGTAIGLNLAVKKIPFASMLGSGLGGASFVKLAIAALIVPSALAIACFALRKVLAAPAGIGADIFTAGAALAPLGAATLISGLIGIANGEVIALLMLCALTYLVLMLYTGLTRAGGLRERAAAPAVPIVIVVAGWLSKVVALALLV